MQTRRLNLYFQAQFGATLTFQEPHDRLDRVVFISNSTAKEMGGILPEWCFQSWAISESPELQEHYRQWQQQQSLVFSYCS